MNIIAYRLPDEERAYIYEAGKSEDMNFSDGKFKFVISPFDPQKRVCQYPLETQIADIPQNILSENYIGAHFEEKTQSEYKEYISVIKEYLETDVSKKIVAARRSIREGAFDPNKIFAALCREYPDAFVFFISTEEFGSWIGASPELLLKRIGDQISTMSLAGTRASGKIEPWDRKNIKEQKIVTDYITEILKLSGLTPINKEEGTRKAGRIEHLMTIIEAENKDDVDLCKLLKNLSPTPALSGFPKEDALEIIKRYEGDRQLYGGYLGPIYNNGDFRLNAFLRCAYLTPFSAILFAGGGITCFSDSEEEWKETEKKLETIGRIL